MIGVPSSSNSRDARRLSARGALALFATAVFLFTSIAHAGRYELVKGKGVDVCEAYHKNLTLLKDHEPVFLYCERITSPQMPEFNRPKWNKLDVWENRQFIHLVEDYTGSYGHGDPSNLAAWEKMLQSEINRQAVVLATMQFPMEADSKSVNALIYERGICNMTHYFQRQVFVLSSTKPAKIDGEKTKLLHASDVVLYKNKPYFDSIGEKTVVYVVEPRRGDEVRPDDVMFTEKHVVRELCEYRYHK